MDPAPPELPAPRWNALPTAVNLVALALLTWGVLSQIGRLAPADQHAAAVLLAASVAGWLGWVGSRGAASRSALVALVVMSVAGGALAAFAPLAMVFPGVAALTAAMRWPSPVAAAAGGGGWLAMTVSAAAADRPLGIVLGGLAVVLAGLLIGTSRRQVAEHAAQVARVEVETARAELERARAELLGERNHLAREIHDVLAHTLAALSLQLEAFATVVDQEPQASPAVRAQLEQCRQLVREGLHEARSAVGALRDDPAPLDDQLRRLCAQQHAAFTLAGSPAPLPPPVAIGLYRVAQEALTNVMKHATGAATSVCLRYAADAVSVTVDNEGGTSAGALHGSGGGYGLRGIGERLAPLGGHVEAGPSATGWRVAAAVPLPAGAPGDRVAP